MYMIKLSYGYGYVGGPELPTTEVLGNYESWDEAADVAQDKFDATLAGLAGECDTCFGEEGSQYDYYDSYDDHVVEVGRVFSGPDYYCKVSIIER